ncbi:hypothetical protein DRQ11_12765 [candidate division KSB1 bacterium]|nr:MAG: hypothetical protein DRQ11_12765 [candidate division KSB1 bacterium]
MQVISCILQDIELGRRQSYDNLTVYPLLAETEASQLPDYLLLDEALNKGLVEIREIGKGRVPELLVINNADQDLLFISGEELLGAKQNRTVNLSVLTPAQSSLNIPVSCTERGRWQEGKNKGKIREGAAHYSSSQVRRVLLSSVTDSLKIKGTYDSDQVSIWDSIDCTIRDFGIVSQTSAQSDIFKKKEADIKNYLNQFFLESGQTGMISMINGKIRALELFGKEETFKKVHPKLLRSYIIEAMKEEETAYVKDDLDVFLEDLERTKLSAYNHLGKGKHIVIEGSLQKGMALMLEEGLVHLCSFRI